MAGVDSLLRMMASHDADELRLGTDLPPKMMKRGAPVRLSIPPTDDAMLQHLLEGILDPRAGQASLHRDGRLELSYDGHLVTLQARDQKAVDAIFRKGAAAPRPAPLRRAPRLRPPRPQLCRPPRPQLDASRPQP